MRRAGANGAVANACLTTVIKLFILKGLGRYALARSLARVSTWGDPYAVMRMLRVVGLIWGNCSNNSSPLIPSIRKSVTSRS